MIKQLQKLFRLLSIEQRYRLLRLQVLVVLMAFAEVAGVFAIGPFMAMVADMSRLASGGTFTRFYELTGLDELEFVFWAGFAVLIVLAVAACVSMFTTWRLASYSFKLGAELSIRLYNHYMRQDWLFHANGSSSSLVSKIAAESARLTNLIINPLLQMVAKFVLVIVMTIAVFIYNPIVAFVGVLVFATGYILLYRTVRRKLVLNGKTVTQSNHKRMSLMQEGFGGIKDVLLLGRQGNFNDRFEKASVALGYAQGNNAVLAQVPRYVMELLAFGSVISLMLYLLSYYQGDISVVLPMLAIYALAGFKLLPAFQQIYIAVTSIRSNLAAFEGLLEDFERSQASTIVEEAKTNHRLSLKNQIVLEDVYFKYPGQENFALQGVNITIPKNSVVGIVGASGSGKSTTVDILLGLIAPIKGNLLLDGKPLTQDNVRSWQNCLGYVSQSIFLSDSTIRQNVAFGIPEEEIDSERVKNAIRMAHLEELVEGLDRGIDTRVGERGVQISGGQRQRIGIARALYDDADVLVMDEATSSLDGITERLVMDAIHDFAGKKTIVMIAHRLATVKSCDRIYLMDAGRVIDTGTYEELIERSTIFRRMASHV